MRLLQLLALAFATLLAATPTIDDAVDKARQNMRRKSPATERAAQVADVPAPYVSPAMAVAGTLILLTAVTMAVTGLVLELGVDLRRTRRVRIRLKPV